MALTIEDSRIYDFNVIKKSLPNKNVSALTEYSISEDKLARVVNQGNVNCCTACVIAEILHAMYEDDYSISYVYGKHRSADSTCQGMTVETALKSLLELGSIPYEMLPQLIEMPEAKKYIASRPELDEYAKSSAIGGYCKISWNNSTVKAENLKLALVNYNLPILAVSKTAFPEPHCIMVYGFETQGRNIFVRFQNSWGKNWAKNGRGTIPLEDVSGMYLLLPNEVIMPFKDVAERAWYYNDVKNMFLAGYVNGKSDDVFAPEDNITRAELCAVLNRVLKRQNDIHTEEVISLEQRITELEAKLREVR